MTFRPSLPAFPGGWRAVRVLLTGWDAELADIELRKGARRAPIVTTVQVDLRSSRLVGQLPIGIDRDIAEKRLVSAVRSRTRTMLERLAAAS